MDIRVYTNPVVPPWHPSDLGKFLGGNEESLVLWSRAMAGVGHQVTIYTSIRGEAFIDTSGVRWEPRLDFKPESPCDVLVSFKARDPWYYPGEAGLKIHWSNDVESPWSSGLRWQVDKFIYLSTYHLERNPWIPPERAVMIPLAIDPEEYRPARDKDLDLAIFATSPDRGLDILLRDWPRIQVTHPGLCLIVAYDWSRVPPW